MLVHPVKEQPKPWVALDAEFTNLHVVISEFLGVKVDFEESLQVEAIKTVFNAVYGEEVVAELKVATFLDFWKGVRSLLKMLVDGVHLVEYREICKIHVDGVLQQGKFLVGV